MPDIPKEALEAAARAIFGPGGLSGGIREVHLNRARLAIRAALAAWPDAGISQFHENAIILPLPQENSDE